MKTSYSLISTVLLFVVHLLLVYFLVGALLAQESENQRYDLAWKGAGLALILLAWVGALLIQRLWQRRWVIMGALALLLMADGLALGGSILLMGVMGVAPDAPPIIAQALTLDQLFWLRSRSEGDNSELLVMDNVWHFEKQIAVNDSLYYSTSWFFQDAHQKRLAELLYESRGSSNVTSLSYSTTNQRTFNAIKKEVAAYHMKEVGRRQNKGAKWRYFQGNGYDVGLAVRATPKSISPTWYTVFVRPIEMRPYRGTLKWK